MIPVFINNRDWLTSTRRLVEHVRRLPDAVPFIVDNASTYPPLLEWYVSLRDVEVIRLEQNVGPHAPWQVKAELRASNYYVVTDSDLDIGNIPLDVLSVLRSGLDRYPKAAKAGLSLEIDDLPDQSPLKDSVRKHELQFWTEKLSPKWWWAGIDTTFAMYRPGEGYGRCYDCLRADRPYTARHLPWYMTPTTLTPEQVYFLKNCNAGSSWGIRLSALCD